MPRAKQFDPEQALDAAVGMFWRSGYEATSIDDLATGLGVSRPAIYREWGSKAGLYQAALERYRERQSGQSEFLDRLAADPADVRAGVRERLLEIVELALAHPHESGCLIVDAVCERAHDDEASRLQATETLRALEDGLATAIRAGVSAGSLGEVRDPRALARLLVVVVVGLRVVGQARPSRPVLRDAVDQALLLLR
jgi:TetR/AcrR family transcriptional repressor of nem operon